VLGRSATEKKNRLIIALRLIISTMMHVLGVNVHSVFKFNP